MTYNRKGWPRKRREFLDLYLAQAYPATARFTYFYRALYQNALLKRLKEGARNLNQLEIWSQRIVEEGSRVILYRQQALAEISPWLNQYHRAMSNQQESLRCIWSPGKRRRSGSKTD